MVHMSGAADLPAIDGPTPPVAEGFLRLHRAGGDEVQVNFHDDLPDLEPFGDRVLPLREQAGLRLG